MPWHGSVNSGLASLERRKGERERERLCYRTLYGLSLAMTYTRSSLPFTR